MYLYKRQKISEKFSKEGQDFAFAACNMFIYSRAVIKFKFSNYDLDLTNIVHKATVNL